MNDNTISDNRPAPARETPPRGYDPDWPSEEELRPCQQLRGLGFWRGLTIALFTVAAALLLAALLAGASGCASPGAELPSGAIDFVTNAAQRAVVVLREAREEPDAPDASEVPEVPEAAGPAATPEAPAAASGPATSSETTAPALDFRYGGVRAKPTEDPRCRISGLRIGSGSLSFHWDTGIPSDWKREDGDKGPMILACAFFLEGGKWIGGKFDWIDEHRSSRSLENIHGGYGGWDGAAWSAAKKHAVCVVSADGKWRSNLLTD